jgi:glycosyltransferase involved in cell wall biosynthesis
MVVGSGTRFLSGISVYTVRLANGLADAGARVSMITMRQLLPTRFYPGRTRVGADLTELRRHPTVTAFDGIDWYWLPSIIRAAWFMGRQRPELIILEWWTGTVLHSYLALCLLARLIGARVIIEFHEVLDTGEVRVPLARRYAELVGGAVVRLAAGYAVHSEFDRALLRSHWKLGGRKPTHVLPHGPHDHYMRPAEPTEAPVLREAPADACNLLFFGVIRPYKGLEDLVEAFERLPSEDVGRFWLTVVGETWEGYTGPATRIMDSPFRDRITFVNRYVRDDELDGYLRGADAVILPYRRSSLSGPLHVAMGYGLPIVISDVGGNAEAAEGYIGIRTVPPSDPAALLAALVELPALRGQRFEHPHTWSHTAEAYEELFEAVAPTATTQAQSSMESSRVSDYDPADQVA